MQYRYLEESNLNGLGRQIAEQFEVWALNAALEYGQYNWQEALALFGASSDVFKERLQKHGIQANDVTSETIVK